MITLTNEDNMIMMARYPDKHFDLAIVDPPYGIGEANGKNHSRGNIVRPTMYKKRSWDNAAPDHEYFIELMRVSKNQIIFGANHFISKIPFDSSCWIVWDKDNGNNDFADCELAWTSFDTAVRYKKYRWAGMFQGNLNNSRDEHLKQKRIHPTEKPIELYKWILSKYAKPGDKILDTHGGSLSIAIACHDLGFDLTACELDTDYYNDALKRFNQFKAQTTLNFSIQP